MKRLAVLGAGTAGTMAVNKLRRRLAGDEWLVTVVDQDAERRYQPGYLFIPFGAYQPSEMVKPRERPVRWRAGHLHLTAGGVVA